MIFKKLVFFNYVVFNVPTWNNHGALEGLQMLQMLPLPHFPRPELLGHVGDIFRSLLRELVDYN